MNELLKKGFFIGLGASALIKESFDRAAREFSKRGEQASEETSQVAKDFLREVQRQLDAVSEKGAKEFERQAADAGIATREDIERLEQRIASLERKLAAMRAQGMTDEEKKCQGEDQQGKTFQV